MIIFKDKEHKYINTEKEIKYTSVTKVIGKYKQPYDGEFWAIYKAVQSMKGDVEFKKLLSNYFRGGNTELHSPKLINHFYRWSGLSKKEIKSHVKRIKRNWKDKSKRSTDKGTKYHNYKEFLLKRKKKVINPFTGNYVPVKWKKVSKKIADNAAYSDLSKLKDGCYPELVISYKDIVGQADLVIIEKGKIYLGDYKSNKEIDFESYYNKKTKKHQMMKDPLSDIMDCSFMHYTLQLSLYGYMLEKSGFKVANLEIHHYNTKYKVDYLKDKVEAMLDHHWFGQNLSHV